MFALLLATESFFLVLSILLIVFLLQFMRDAMRGIQFQQGCDEEEDYPLIIEIGDIGLIILKPAAQESIHLSLIHI